MAMKKKKIETFEMENARTMAELIADPTTTEHLRVTILNKLLDSREGFNFFITMFEENLSQGNCPNCGHENHWAIPENDLNQMGYVTYARDPKVNKRITAADCPEFQEACNKKRIVM